jgi:hypothetical protein
MRLGRAGIRLGVHAWAVEVHGSGCRVVRGGALECIPAACASGRGLGVRAAIGVAGQVDAPETLDGGRWRARMFCPILGVWLKTGRSIRVVTFWHHYAGKNG